MAGDLEHETRICPHCGELIKAKASKCKFCKQSVVERMIECPACAENIPEGSRICPECDENLIAPSPKPAGPVDVPVEPVAPAAAAEAVGNATEGRQGTPERAQEAESVCMALSTGTIERSRARFVSLAVSHDGRYLAANAGERLFKVWDLWDGSVKDFSEGLDTSLGYKGKRGAFSFSKLLYATADRKDCVVVHDLERDRSFQVARASDTIGCVRFLPNTNKVVALIRTGPGVGIFDLDSGKLDAVTGVHTSGGPFFNWNAQPHKLKGTGIDMAAMPSGRAVLVHTSEMIAIVDIETGHTRVLSKSMVTSMALSPAGDQLYWIDTSWFKRFLFRQDVESGRIEKLVQLHSADATCMLVSPDGMQVVFGDWDAKVHLFNLTSCSVSQLGQHADDAQISGLAFTPNGRHLFSCNHEIRLWEVAG